MAERKQINHQPPPHLINQFGSRLLAWYAEHGRDLPWRRTQNPYHILVSEFMLQQTQVKRVLRFYSRFLEAFPNLTALAEAPLDRVLKMWEGMGYHARVAFWVDCGNFPAESVRRGSPWSNVCAGRSGRSWAFAFGWMDPSRV